MNKQTNNQPIHKVQSPTSDSPNNNIQKQPKKRKKQFEQPKKEKRNYLFIEQSIKFQSLLILDYFSGIGMKNKSSSSSVSCVSSCK